jgi:choline dehydrogenase
LRVAPYYLGVTKPDPAAQFTTVFGTIISPLSKGSIDIVSNSTEDLPLVDLAYFSDPGDMEQAVAAVKRIRDLYASASQTSLLDGPEFVPGANVTADADIKNYIRENTGMIFNAAGTTKMGKADDATAVVDPQCCMYGVERLRVVDTGSFPFVPPGYAQSTAYMLAEKIADDIKNRN